MKHWLCYIAFLFVAKANAQELFINNEPASTVPKGVLGVRMFGESWNEIGPFSNVYRNMAALRLMYGVTSKLTVYATGTASNHHTHALPADLLTHTHAISGANINYKLGIPYLYQYNGIDLYAKYRFLSIDGQNRHFRIAAYGEWSNVNVAHDEAEPHLLDDNKGFGGGLISTFLNKRFATSLTTGYVIPGTYTETAPSFTPVPGITTTAMTYGRAYIYDLSFGYLVLPRHYESYSQTNLSVYLEFMGESYDNANVTQNGVEVVTSQTTPASTPTRSPLLLAYHYVDIHPGLQAIFNSNLRVDFSMGFPLINKSYTVFYPMYMLSIQRYFFL